MTTITWTISQLDRRTSDGFVTTAHWTATAVDGDYSASIYSTCTLPAADPASFTPYADLTQEQVLGWIWANGVNQAATEAAVQQQIEMQKNPPVIQPPLPWITP